MKDAWRMIPADFKNILLWGIIFQFLEYLSIVES